MTLPRSLPSSGAGVSGELMCPKCHHANPGAAGVCASCGKHLHVSCRHCGQVNYRGNSRCEECRTQLHWAWPARWKPARARRWIQAVELALLVASVTLTYKGIVKISEFEFPKRQEPAPSVYVLNPDGTWQRR